MFKRIIFCLCLPVTGLLAQSPTVTSHLPTQNTVDVAANSNISVNFSTSINGSTLDDDATFNVDGDLDAVIANEYITMKANLGVYYIVIKHRNHLSVMSASAHTLATESSTLYDFSAHTDAKQVDTDPANVYRMYAGDASGNDQVQNSDKNDYWKVQAKVKNIFTACFRG